MPVQSGSICAWRVLQRAKLDLQTISGVNFSPDRRTAQAFALALLLLLGYLSLLHLYPSEMRDISAAL